MVSHHLRYFGVLLELLFEDLIRYAVVNGDLLRNLHEPLISHVPPL